MDGYTTTTAPHPHQQPARRRPRPLVVPVILGINIVVFLAWQLSSRVPSLQALLVENFTVSVVHLTVGHVWTLLTAAFSHYDWWHMLINMFVLWSFGGPLEIILGRRVFSAFYLVAAVFSSVSHCAVSALLLGRTDVLALGASGAISGLLLIFALLFPKHRILLFGIVPVPALVGALGFVAFDLWGLFAQSAGGGLPIGHGAHLGGALCGAIMFFTYLKPRLEAVRSRQRSARPSPTIALSAEEAEEFERIRSKLTSGGVNALTPKEKDFLRRIRERAIGN
jgi:membrane associated rhomboid family serine protease